MGGGGKAARILPWCEELTHTGKFRFPGQLSHNPLDSWVACLPGLRNEESVCRLVGGGGAIAIVILF